MIREALYIIIFFGLLGYVTIQPDRHLTEEVAQ